VEIEPLLETFAAEEDRVTGIATDVESRELLWVASDNRPIAITDGLDQERLRKQIVATLANYYHERRQRERLTRKSLRLPPDFAGGSVIPPVRWFWAAIRWEQTGPVARAVDLFGESSLVPERPREILPSPIPLAQLLEAIDRRLAGWSASPLAADAAGVTATGSSRARQLYRLISEAIEHFLASRATSFENNPGSFSLPRTGTLSARESVAVRTRVKEGPVSRPGDDPFTIAKIIRAAIDHFFPPLTEPCLSAGEDDPWLLSGDLSTGPANSPGKSEDVAAPVPERLPGGISPPPLPSTTIKNKTSQDNRGNSLQKVTPDSGERIPRPLSGSPPDEEWWEAGYTPAGYEKHPLERVLGWLDRIILRVEEFFLRVWRELRPRRRKSKTRERR
jgi:hypothetical protein